MADDIWISASTTAWSTTGNWSLGTVPANTNNVYMNAANSVIDVASGLAQSGVTLASFNADMSYTGLIGTSTSYLNIGATTFNIGGPSVQGTGNGSRRMNIQAANSGAVINVMGSGGAATDTGMTPVRLLTTAAVLNCTGGTTGVAIAVGETSSVATLNMTKGANAPSVILGAGVTLTTGSVLAGSLTSYSANATGTLTVAGAGTYTHNGTAGFSTSLNIGARSTVSYNGTGTITLLNSGGTIDFSGGTGAVTITNANLYAGATINDPLGRVTFTNPFKTVQCTLADVTVKIGYNRNYQVS